MANSWELSDEEKERINNANKELAKQYDPDTGKKSETTEDNNDTDDIDANQDMSCEAKKEQIKDKIREQNGYDNMSDEEKEKFDQQLDKYDYDTGDKNDNDEIEKVEDDEKEDDEYIR